jgi:long-chain fatty acid transport protein
MHMTQVNCDQLQEWGAIIAPFQQDWNDQIVLAMGLSYQFNDALTGRIGYNYANNPIPNQFVNYLWPAIAENHYTGGFGYAFNKQSAFNFALSYVPEVSVTGTGAAMPAGNGGMQINHSQVNWQLMYTYKF